MAAPVNYTTRIEASQTLYEIYKEREQQFLELGT